MNRVLIPVTIFLSAFLLFQVQPIMGRFILPWFGGTPAVWSVCLLFFQAMLLAGYAYAHWLRRPRVHMALLAVSLAFLPVIPARPAITDTPTAHILLLLIVTVGAPYFLLSATAPFCRNGPPPVGTFALATLRTIELRIVPGLVELSVSGRAVRAFANASLDLVGILRDVRRSSAGG